MARWLSRLKAFAAKPDYQIQSAEPTVQEANSYTCAAACMHPTHIHTNILKSFLKLAMQYKGHLNFAD